MGVGAGCDGGGSHDDDHRASRSSDAVRFRSYSLSISFRSRFNRSARRTSRIFFSLSSDDDRVAQRRGRWFPDASTIGAIGERLSGSALGKGVRLGDTWTYRSGEDGASNMLRACDFEAPIKLGATPWPDERAVEREVKNEDRSAVMGAANGVVAAIDV